MNDYTEKELHKTLDTVSSIIVRCEKMQPKFQEGTAQHTLLKNRIKAMYIVKALIEKNNIVLYTNEDLEKAIPPVTSIIHKCEKAQMKFEEGSSQYMRFNHMIEAMYIAEVLIVEEKNKRNKKY